MCVRACVRVCVCVCVMLYYVGMCFYAEIEIKFIPPPGVEDKIFLFLYIFCCISESAFFFPHKLHSWQPFSAITAATAAAAVPSTVRLYIEVTKVECGGWSCACSKWCYGSHSRASCSPVPPWLCSEGVDGIQNKSPWRFGMTGDTNYCSAASVSPSLRLSHSERNTTLSLSLSLLPHTHLSSAWSSSLPLTPMSNVLMFRGVLCSALWWWGRGTGGIKVSQVSLSHQGCMNIKACVHTKADADFNHS